MDAHVLINNLRRDAATDRANGNVFRASYLDNIADHVAALLNENAGLQRVNVSLVRRLFAADEPEPIEGGEDG
jgi:hypothetical protein